MIHSRFSLFPKAFFAFRLQKYDFLPLHANKYLIFHAHFTSSPPSLAATKCKPSANANLFAFYSVEMDLPNKMLIACRIMPGRGDCENFPDNNSTIFIEE